MPQDHKFYATEVDATLVEIKYYLQALSMLNSPICSHDIKTLFTPWLIKHSVEPGAESNRIVGLRRIKFV
jgi:hypothetical protein